MALSCFSVCTLHHIQASNKHPVVCHLWHPNLLVWHAFRRIVSPMAYTLSHKSDPRFGRNWDSDNPTSPVKCSFVKIWLSPWLGYKWQFAMAVASQRNPSCEARFPWKNFRTQGAAGRITCKFTITSERKTGPPQKTEESEPNECGRIPARRTFFGKDKECGSDNRITKFTITWNARRTFIEKHMESGRVSATHVLVEKRHGLRERLVACHMNYNHIERETRLTWENTRKVNPRNAAGFLRGSFSPEKSNEYVRDRPHHI